MNLYHIKRKSPTNYDEYSDFVVAAHSAEAAFKWGPDGRPHKFDPDESHSTWPIPTIDDVEIRCIGTAKYDVKAGVICSSFRAG